MSDVLDHPLLPAAQVAASSSYLIEPVHERALIGIDICIPSQCVSVPLLDLLGSRTYAEVLFNSRWCGQVPVPHGVLSIYPFFAI